MDVVTYLVVKITFVEAWIIYKGCVIASLVAKITLSLADTSLLMAKITFAVAEITLKVAVITGVNTKTVFL